MVSEAPRVTRTRKKYKKTKAQEKAKEKKQQQKNNSAIPDTWKLKFDYNIDLIQPRPSFFYQTNIGVGFLYFSGVKGNLMGNPPNAFVTQATAFTAPIKGSYTYNRTPLFENIIGYRIFPWLKAGISYQHQAGITFQTAAVHSFVPANFLLDSKAQLTSEVSLDGAMAKVYFENPHPAVIRRLAISPSIAFGLGIGWQTWRRTKVLYYQMFPTNRSVAEQLILRQKISANCIWMVDVAFRMQSTDIDSNISVTMGCKYNQWGQARNIGKLSQQGAQNLGLLNPFRIKTVYQFAPYLGLQWNFPNTYVSKHPYTINGKNPDRFAPTLARLSSFQPKESLWTQFNAGIGFLYFATVRGNLATVPSTLFTRAAFPISVSAPLRGRLSYNQTPLFEYLVGYRFFPWFKAALSYQHQGNITVQTRSLDNIVVPAVPAARGRASWAKFTSNLDLDAIETKFFFELPYSMIIKNISCTPLLAAAVGIGWQSWTQMDVEYSSMGPTNNPGIFNFGVVPLHSKVSQNLVWSADAALRFQSALPSSSFSFLMGCKYNQWGQARNMGMLSQQASHKFGLLDPLKIKTVYQFAPYLGVQWDFVDTYTGKKPYSIGGKSINRWRPWFVSTDYLQKMNCFWAQFNVAPGFLYFSDVRGNLALRPAAQFTLLTGPSNPYRGRLIYNKTPLFEYMLGFRFTPWYKLALSYQHQGGVTIQSKWLSFNTVIPGSQVSQQQVQFRSNVSFDGIMLKNYFEYPKALIFKGTATTPYIAPGFGVGWQTWSKNEILHSSGFSDARPVQIFSGTEHGIRQKISANFIWMVDVGFRIRSALPNPGLNILVGCKYNQWGQARNIGKASQQGRNKTGMLAQPFRIKVIYQFAPYLGVQWNF